MTPAEKKKRRQILILIALSAVLLAVIYWQYLLSPTLQACDELDEEILSNETILAEMQSEMAAMPGYQREAEDTLGRINESTAELYPYMNTEDADILLLQSMTSSGLSAVSLSAAAAPAGESSDDGSEDTGTGVYVITAAYSAKGSYSALLSFISKVNDMPAVVITSLSGTAAETDDESLVISAGGGQTIKTTRPASENDMEFSITAQVYMYVAPEIPEHFDVQTAETLEAESVTAAEDYL